MDKFGQIIILIFSVIMVEQLDEKALFPVILQNIPSPFDWLLILVISTAELVGLVAEAAALFK
ncbi:MAG: hypothetical protein MUO17_05660 [Dehalococcoidales bacterium]|nr:hypothetical protein [Dehalococcoidales bacterium]